MSTCIWNCFVSHEALTNGWWCCLCISLTSRISAKVCLRLKPVRATNMQYHHDQRIQSIWETAKKDFIKWLPHVPLATLWFLHLGTLVSFPSPSFRASISNTRALVQTLLCTSTSNRHETELQWGEQGAEPISLLLCVQAPSGAVFHPPKQLHLSQTGRSCLCNCH